MHPEGSHNQGESEESRERLFEQEIHRALSPTWAKSTQELLPGYLPNKPRGEYTEEELLLYRCAYSLLGEMVKRSEVEVSFVEEEISPVPNSTIEDETLAIPRFKLMKNGGKRSRNEQVAWSGGIVTDPQT